MSMTREEALGYLRAAIAHAADVDDELGAYARTALSILAPSPRKEPPTVDEVGDEEMCLNYTAESEEWNTYTGDVVRRFWQPNCGELWLPLSALPTPEGNPL